MSNYTTSQDGGSTANPYHATIKIQHIDGYPVWIDALVIGQIAVHASLFNPNTTIVSHVKTGFAVAAYSAYHVAVNFAKRINEWYDFDALVSGNDRELFEAVGNEVLKMAKDHPAYLHQHPEESEHGGWDYLKGGAS